MIIVQKSQHYEFHRVIISITPDKKSIDYL